MKKNNIILIGFMGCGKTTAGGLLAKKLGYELCDTDQFIETTEGMTISDIFALKGEDYFRALETKTLEKLVENAEHMIVSTGGGLPLRECNAKLLGQLGLVVYLKATKETVYDRVKADSNRPLLTGGNVMEKIEALLAARMPLYEKAAHLCIVTDGRTAEEIVDEIIKEYHA